MLRRAALVASAGAVLACSAPSPTPQMDGPSATSGSADSCAAYRPCSEPAAVKKGPALVLGTGTDCFEPLEPDEPQPIIVGPQGGFHVWLAVRCAGIEPNAAKLTLRLLDESGSSVGIEDPIVRTMWPCPIGGDWTELPRVFGYLAAETREQAEALVGTELTVEATASDALGGAASTSEVLELGALY